MSWSIQNKPQQAQPCLQRAARSEGHTGKWKKQPAGFLRDYTAPAFILLPSYFGAKKAVGRSLLCSEKPFHQKGWSSLRAATPSAAQCFLCTLSQVQWLSNSNMLKELKQPFIWKYDQKGASSNRRGRLQCQVLSWTDFYTHLLLIRVPFTQFKEKFYTSLIGTWKSRNWTSWFFLTHPH